MPAKEYFGVEDDTLIEVDITPNRADGASHYGVARDLYAYYQAIKNGDEIVLAGMNDLTFYGSSTLDENTIVFKEMLNNLGREKGDRTGILLSHRPEIFDTYVESGFEVVLTGHAHGGQIRLPFVGGILTPNQGFFPEYDAGLYQKENTSMIISRGLGNSLFPFRIGNRPEIIVCELEK